MTAAPHHSAPLKPRILTATIATLLLTARLLAATDTWDGNSPNAGAGDSNISTGVNWADNTAPPSDLANTDLIFAGTTKLTPNFSSPFSAKSVTFQFLSAGVFTLGGSALTIGSGGIANNTNKLETIGNSVIVGVAATSFLAGTGGGLTFTNTVDLGTNALSVVGIYSTSFADFSGTGSVTKGGAGTMTWAPTTITSADIIVNSGNLNIAYNGSATTSATPFTFGGSASLAVNGTSFFNSDRPLILDGGAQVTRQAGAIFGSNVSLTVQGGSSFVASGDLPIYQLTKVTGTSSTLQTIAGGLQCTTVNALNILTLSGGTLTTASLVNNGTVDFQKGTLAITGAGGLNTGTGALGRNVVLGTSANLQVTGTTTVASGATLRTDGGSFSGGALTNDGTIDHRGGTSAFTGALTNKALPAGKNHRACGMRLPL